MDINDSGAPVQLLHPGNDLAQLTVNSGGQLTAENTRFDWTRVTLGPSSLANIQASDFDNPLFVNGSAGLHFKFNDLTDLPGNNEGLIAIGDSTDTIDLSENWWGTTDPNDIEDKVFHQVDNSSRPFVEVSPILTQPPQFVDYEPISLSLSSSPLIAGSSLEAEFNIRNNSPIANANASSVALFFLNTGNSEGGAFLLDAVSIEAIAAGNETGVRTIRLDLPDASHPVWSNGLPSEYAITVLADATDAVVEFDDSNNRLTANEMVIEPFIDIGESYGTTEVVEGSQKDLFELKLNSAPADDVIVTAVPDSQLDLGNGPGVPLEVTIDSDDWQTPLELPVSTAADELTEGTQIGEVRFEVNSEDNNFNGIDMPVAEVLILESAIRPVVESILITDGETRSQVTSLSVEFDRVVDHTGLDEAFELINSTTDTPVTSLIIEATDQSGRTVVDIRFGDGDSVETRLGEGLMGNSLSDGNYRLEIVGENVREVGSDRPMVTDTGFGGTTAAEENGDRFFRLLGDTNGDGVRDALDIQQIIPTLFSPANYRNDLDTNGDGVIDAIDLQALIPTLFGSPRD